MLTKEYITELKNKGNGDLGYLVGGLKDNPSILYVLENMGYLPKNFDGRFLFTLLSHEYHKIRFLAAKNIGKINTTENLAYLYKIFEN